MLFFAAPASPEPAGLILGAAEARVERARRLAQQRQARRSATQLLARLRAPR
jgi:hypothetical protein